MRKLLSKIFAVLAIILSDIMCAIVAYNYCALEYSNPSFPRTITSAPPSVAYLYAIPFVIGIGVCIILAIVLRRK
jgi:hypothetical protein